MITSQINVAIIDYGMGNLRSVFNAMCILNCAAKVTKNPQELRQATHIILPGVGAFGDGMCNLKAGGWIEVLEEEVRRKGKPFLGICLGMQLLATIGTEHGTHKGLNWISGTVERLQIPDASIRVPHVGWNDANFVKKDHLFVGLGNTQDFYFVHSYVLLPEDESVISSTTEHGVNFVSSIEVENIYATQFHPEKSQKAGLAVLTNFIKTGVSHA